MVSGADGIVRTWDGKPVSQEPPFGAMIVVYRWSDRRLEFLVLHRGQHGPDFEGEWAWGPPSGARSPGEAIARCAERELLEETGLDLSLCRACPDSDAWYVYLAEAGDGAEPRLSAEHDRYAWLSLDDAAERITPEVVRAQFTAAAARLQRHPKDGSRCPAKDH